MCIFVQNKTKREPINYLDKQVMFTQHSGKLKPAF